MNRCRPTGSPAMPAAILLFGLCAISHPGRSADAVNRPNFLIIFADDQGYRDLVCYGPTDFRTPRIDQLAQEGNRFSRFYAQITSGPSRSALLTGRYPIQSHGCSMLASEITVAELLQHVGYTIGYIGKQDASNRRPFPERIPHVPDCCLLNAHRPQHHQCRRRRIGSPPAIPT